MRSEAVLHLNTDLEFHHVAVEVSRHKTLAQQCRTVHLGFDAASAVISAPSSPERAA